MRMGPKHRRVSAHTPRTSEIANDCAHSWEGGGSSQSHLSDPWTASAGASATVVKHGHETGHARVARGSRGGGVPAEATLPPCMRMAKSNCQSGSQSAQGRKCCRQQPRVFAVVSRPARKRNKDDNFPFVTVYES
jgi:hypothetical protein